MTRNASITLIFVAILAYATMAQTTEFTYQGSLTNGGSAANGSHDFEFVLFDALSGGGQAGSVITVNGVTVTNGIFAVKLDFGAAFPGAGRYLEIHVRQTGGAAFIVLTPRQSVSSVPYSVKSLNADSATNAANAVNAVNAVNATNAATATNAGTAQNAVNAANAVNASTATNALQLGGVAANQFVVTTDPRMSDARSPNAGSGNYIQNQNSAQQASSNFNISGNGTATILNATTQYNLGGQRMLSVSGPFSAGVTATASNTFLGENAGVNTMPAATINDPTGKFNTFTGALAGVANTTGGNNAFFGGAAGNANTTGNQNSYFGTSAGRFNTTGGNNTFSGGFAGFRNTTQHDNTFVGFFAGNANGTNDTTSLANFNTFVGSQSGNSNTTGGNNTLIGNLAGSSNQTGGNNTIIGSGANVGANNLINATAIGANALVSQSNSLVLGNNANVGIGTTAPTQTLHVVGNGLFTGNLTVNGTLNLPSFAGQFIQNSTSQQTSSNFNISGNGIIGGNLGIGTNNPGQTLDVQSNGSSVIRAKSSGGSGVLVLDRASAVSANSAQVSFSSGGATDFAMGTSQGSAGVSDFSIYNYGTANNAFTIQKGSNNVGMGTATPNTALHLRSASTTGFAIQMENTSTAKRLYIGNYGTTGGGNHWPGLNSANTSFLYAENPLIFTTPGGIMFSGSSTAEHMRITPDGNVGIGTTNPLEKLHVSGRAIFNVPGNNGFRITPGTDADIGVLNVTNAANTVNWLTVGSNGQVIMNGSGNVGIGTTSPTVKLQVGNAATSGGLTTLRVYGAGEFVHSVKLDTVLPFVSGVRSICVDLSGFISECSSSSLRYKSDIGRFRSGLDVINVLRPITFRWKSDGSFDFGLAAEEVEKAMPGLVYRNKDGQVDGVRYDRIGVVLINAVKEQQAQIETQAKQIEKQNATNKKQEADIDKQRNEILALTALVCRSHRRAAVCRAKN